MNTADLAIVAGTIVELATVGTVGVLVYTRRILLAATPKPQAPPTGEANRKRKADADAPEVPAAAPAGGELKAVGM